MIRRILPWFVGLAAAASAVIFFGWLIVAQKVEEGVLVWAEARRAEGYAVSWKTLDIGGFPFRFEIVMAEPKVSRNGWSAETPRLEARYAPWRPDRIDIASPRMALSGPDASGSLDEVRAEVTVRGGQATQVAIEGTSATGKLRGEDLGRSDRARLVVDSFNPAANWQTESLAGSMSLWGAKPAPQVANQLLFPDPFDLALTGAVKGPLLDLAGWRDAGGTLDLSRLVLVWGPMKMDSNATIALDAQMRPLGAGTAKVQGLNPMLDRLVAKGQVRAQEASVAKVVLGMLAQPTADGGSEVSLPISAQDGKLFLGPVAIATLRPVAP